MTTGDNKTEWNGLVRQLSDGKADIFSDYLTISKARAEVIDYSIGLLEEINSLVYLNPARSENGKPTQINLMVFLTVFSKATWLAILVLAMVVAATELFLHVGHDLTTTELITLGFLARSIASGMHRFFLSLIDRNEDARDSAKSTATRIAFLAVSWS